MSWEELRAVGQAAFENGNHVLCQKVWTQALEETKADGENSLRTATSSLDLAKLNHAQGNYTAAEEYIDTALTIRENQLGKNHLQLAECFSLLAKNYLAQARPNECEQLYKRSLQIREKGLGKR